MFFHTLLFSIFMIDLFNLKRLSKALNFFMNCGNMMAFYTVFSIFLLYWEMSAQDPYKINWLNYYWAESKPLLKIKLALIDSIYIIIMLTWCHIKLGLYVMKFFRSVYKCLVHQDKGFWCLIIIHFCHRRS